MIETKYFCDKCGSVILTDRTVLDVKCGPIQDRLPRVDLCFDCSTYLVDWIRDREVEQFVGSKSQ